VSCRPALVGESLRNGGMIDYFKEQSDVAKESWKMSEDNVDAAKYWAYHLAYKDAEFKASNIKEGEK
jgi:hypothetical protein